MPGITPTGFVAKTLDQILASLEAGYRGVYGPRVNVDPRGRNGQKIGIFAGALSEVWNLAEALASALNPREATGAFLDNIVAFNGMVRRPASYSTVTLTATGTPTTALPSGRVAKVPASSAQFQTLALATIAAADAWAGTTAYVLGNRVTNAGRVYQCLSPGVSASSGGPTTTEMAIGDGAGDLVWRYLGQGTGVVDVAARATVTGPVQGYSGTITEIGTAVSGWSSVVNLLDARPGANIEMDPELSVRREATLAAIGKSPLPAISAQLFKVPDVSAASVFENCLDDTVDGIPPHSVEALVEGGADADIRAALFTSVAGGIQPYGNVSGSVVDSEGTSHSIGFSRVTDVDIWVRIDLEYLDGAYPANGDAQVKAALVAYGNPQKSGRNVVPSMLSAAVIAAVPGVINVLLVYVRTSSPAIAATPIALTPRQNAAYDTSRISVNSVPGDY